MNAIRTITGLSLLLVSTCALSCGATSRPTTSARMKLEGQTVAVLDDMEDQNTQTKENEDGYLGYWYTYDDHEDCVQDYCCGMMMSVFSKSCVTPEVAGCPGTMSPAPADKDFPMSPISTIQNPTYANMDVQTELADSQYAARITGGGYETWGAGMGLTLNDDQIYVMPADFTGLRFLGYSDTGPLEVTVKIQDSGSRAGDGICKPQTTCEEKQGCYGDPETKVMFTKQWQLFEIPFSQLAPPNWTVYMDGVEAPTGFDPSTAYQVQFQVDYSQGEFDIWVDNLGFTLTAAAQAQ